MDRARLPAQIDSAIATRRLLVFDYHGHSRVVEPHIHGVDRHGHDALAGYQVDGGSESGEPVGWKLFHVADIHGLQILPARFHRPRQGYNPDDATFSSVHARLPGA